MIHALYRKARRIVVFTVGSTVLVVGIVLLVTPGPAFVVIPVGLMILAIEFRWARRWLRKIRSSIERGNGHDAPPDVPSSLSSGGSSK